MYSVLTSVCRKKPSSQHDLSMSADITDGRVNLEHESDYEDLNTIIRCDQEGLKAVDNHATDESLTSSCPPTMSVKESREKSSYYYNSQEEGQWQH